MKNLKVTEKKKSEYISLKDLYNIKKSRYSKPLKEHPNNYRPLHYEEAEVLYELSQITDTNINFDVGGYDVYELSFAGSRLKKIPELIGNLKELRYLTISCPQLEELPDSIGNLKKLIKLSITSEHNLTKIPEILCNLTLLEELTLEKNKLKSLPDAIGGLISLKNLILNDNELEILPNSVGKLKSLKKLELRNNQLSKLPNSIGDLESLKELSLSNNKIKTLPKTIGDLSSLEEFHIDHNKLSVIPESFGNLTLLNNLLLHNNELIELPSSIGKLKLLSTIEARNNKLTTIPDTIGNIRNLRNLALQNNNLTKLPDSIGNIRNLNSIYLDNNQLTSLPDTIGNLKFLNYVNIKNNNFTAYPNKLGHVDIVYLEGNKLLEKDYPETGQIERSESIAIQSLEKILGRKLGIGWEDNSILYIEIKDNYVSELDLTRSNLNYIPNCIASFTHLETLNMSQNKIKEIPSFILDFENLHRLIMDDNPICKLSQVFKNNLLFATYPVSSGQGSYVFGERITITLNNNHKRLFKILLSSNFQLENSLKSFYKDNFSNKEELIIISSKLSKILTREEFLEYINNLNINELKKYFSSAEESPLLFYLDGMLRYLDKLGVIRSYKTLIYDVIKALGPYIIQYLLGLLIDQEKYLRVSVLEALVHIDEFNKNILKDVLFSTPHKLKIRYIFHLSPYITALLDFLNPLELFRYIDKFHAQHLKSTFRCRTIKAQTIIAEIIMRESVDGQIIEKLAEQLAEAVIEISNLDPQSFIHDFLPEEVIDLLRKLYKIVISAPLNNKILNCIDHIQSVEEEWKDY